MGRLTIVGTGMTLGAHLSQRSRNIIESADVVFSCCHPIMDEWIASMNDDVRFLQPLYQEGKDRRITYQEMQTQIMTEVALGKHVVGAFYGHPGVFAQVPHACINESRERGFAASMEPGISAEDCLYADMGIDPGELGCQHLEASQLMFYHRKLDTSGYLILWQVALAGDLSIKKRVSSVPERQLLVELLSADYPLDHRVAVYECPTLIVDAPRIEWFALGDLAQIALSQVSTLVIPPAKGLDANHDMLKKLRALAL